MPTLGATLMQRPVVLDGGLATELDRRGHDLSGGLWSARLLVEAPEAIVVAHSSYAAAGAEVATTVSYQLSYAGAAAVGLDDDETDQLLQTSVQLARASGSTWVAASVGPYGATLADGSEYRGDDELTVDQLRRWHRRRLQVLAECGADVLALETIPSIREVEALVREVDALGVPVWVSVTCEGASMRDGTPASDAFDLAASSEAVVAIGVNCTAPDDVPALVRAASATGKPVVVYPNSGETWHASRRRWSGPPGFDASAVASWLDCGARLIGGCCRVGPDQVRSIAETVRAAH